MKIIMINDMPINLNKFLNQKAEYNNCRKQLHIFNFECIVNCLKKKMYIMLWVLM